MQLPRIAIPLIAIPLIAIPLAAIPLAAHALAAPVTTGIAPAGAAATPSPVSRHVTPAPRTQQVRLITGDLVTLSPATSSPRIASIQRANPSGPSGRFSTIQSGDHFYVIPQSAVPYLGTTLDLGLFDVAALVGHRVAQIHLTYRDGRATVAAPSPSAAEKFGAALGRQWAHDHAAPTHHTGVFANIAEIRPSAATRPTVRPNSVMHTLTVTGRDLAGRPDEGDMVSIWNVDDLRASPPPAVFHGGKVRLNVPAGHYSAAMTIYDGFVQRTDVLAQFTVSRDTIVGMDARRTTARFRVHTPRPTVPEVAGYILSRTDRRGESTTMTAAGFAPDEFAFSPTTTRVTVGRLHLMLNARLFSPTTSVLDESYDLAYPVESTIPKSLAYTVGGPDLAVEDATYPAQQPDRYEQALDTRIAVPPWLTDGFLIATEVPMTVPSQRREYYSAYEGLQWRSDHWSVYNRAGLFGEVQTAFRSYTAGAHTAVSWGGPAHPRLFEGVDPYEHAGLCPACVGDGTLTVRALPYSDNSPVHYGLPDAPAAGLTESQAYTISADGTTLAQGTGVLDAQVRVPPSVAQLRIDYRTTRSSADFLQSTDVTTSWQVPAGVPTTAMPAGWRCGTADDAPKACRELPLITASYLLPADDSGALHAGTAQAGLSLGHLGRARPAFSSVTAQVSFDDGRSWIEAAVTLGTGGHYGVRFDVPDGASYGGLRVQAHDANGAQFHETITRAFAVGKRATY